MQFLGIILKMESSVYIMSNWNIRCKLIISFGLFFMQFLQAQEQCKTHQLHEELLKLNAEYRSNYNEIQRKIFSTCVQNQTNHSRSKLLYTIPVVIHLMVPPGTPIGQGNNLTDIQIDQGLDYLNQAFSNLGAFNTSLGVDTEIQFCLAVRDPNGLPSSGITRTETNLVADLMPCSPFGTSSANDAAIKSLSNWDCRQYLNIWLVTDLYDAGFGCGLAGYAYFPGAPCTVDGVVQEARYWNTIGGTRVTAHEVGHYLSLNHTFNGGCNNNNCLLDGDQVCDTPPDNSPSFAPCNTNSCNTDSPDLPDDNSNYMDYTGCTPMHFTQGQKQRMISGLENGRRSLITSKACVPVVPLDGSLQSLFVTTPTCEGPICPQIVWKNTGLNTLINTEFKVKYDNAVIISVPWSGSLFQNSSLIVNLPCANLSVGNHTLLVYTENTNNSADNYTKNDSQFIRFTILPKPTLSIKKITGTHCISDGTVELSAIRGTAPYLFELFPLQYTQNVSFFRALSSGNYKGIIKDINMCADTIDVIVPDSCSSTVPKNFITNRDAIYQGNDCYRLTDALQGQVGSIWYDQKIDLNQSFDVVFDINLGCIDGNGADGIAFLLQPLSTSIGTSGGGLGYAGVTPSIAVEFDTYQNCCSNSTSNTAQDGNDPTQDHMAIMRSGSVNHLSNNNLAGPVDILQGRNAEDCTFHPVRISWNAATKKFDCYLDCVLKLTYSGDIIKDIFSGNPNVYFGFTAATGGSINVQQVCFKYISFLDKLVDQTICKNSGIQIAADDDFTRYKWTPNSGVSNPNIRNPIFSPQVTTEYIVEMMDACGFTVVDTVLINVIDLNVNLDIKYNNPCTDSITADITANIIPNSPAILYSLDGINFSSQNEFLNLPIGPVVIYAKIGACVKTTLYYIKPTIPLHDSLIAQSAVRCNQKGLIFVTGVNGYPPYQYNIDGSAFTSNSFFSDLDSGRHSIVIRDSLGCEIVKEFYLPFLRKKLELSKLDSDLIISCQDSSTFFMVEAKGTSPLYQYILESGEINNFGRFENLKSGKHKIFALDDFGCNSDTLEFDVINRINHKYEKYEIQICEGDSYTVGTKHYTQIGKYIDTLTTIEFCDSIIETELSYFRKESINIIEEICEGDFFQVGNRKYFTAGKFVDTLKNIHGCDSIISSDIMVNNLSRVKFQPVICDGDFITVGAHKYFIAGQYADTLVDLKGCDSLVITNLKVNPIFLRQNVVQICEADTLKVGKSNYFLEGNYTDTLTTYLSCDSVIQTELKINPRYFERIIVEICEGDFYTVGFQNYTQSGIYIDTLQSSSQCDSVISLRLLVNPNTKERINRTTCENEPLEINNEKFFRSGTYFQQLENSKNCDSVLQIDLSVIDTHIVMKEFILCNGDSILVGGNQYKLSGNYTDILSAITGCDSTVLSKIDIGDDFYCDSLHCRVYIPNIFSPNSDQINEEFQFFSPVLEVNYLAIYDRWGALIAERKELNPTWDGKNSNGELMIPGVYVYYMKATCSNGKQVSKYGDITLIR